MLGIIGIHEYRESFSMQYNSMCFQTKKLQKKFLLDKYSDSTEVKLLRNNHLLSFQCDINGEYAQHLKRRRILFPYPSARTQCETAFSL